MLVISLLFVCASAALAAPSEKQIFDLEDEAQLVQLFNKFKKEYQRNYRPHEHSARYQKFVRNLARINAMNEQDPTATYGISEFADMGTEEILTRRTGFVPDSSFIPTAVVNVSHVPDIEVPQEFDWRAKNAVTTPKNQGNCGSCWAFSAVGNIEGQYAIKHQQLVDFSAQELVACNPHNKGYGCDGGNMAQAFKFLIYYGGIETEQDYPYTAGRGAEGACKFNKTKIKAIVTESKLLQLSTMSEDQVAQLLVATGPLSIAIDANQVVEYKGGIIQKCACEELNHGVLLVGYGEEKGVKYWLVKNSWGTANGEAGFFRIKRGVNCLGFLNDMAATSVLA